MYKKPISYFILSLLLLKGLMLPVAPIAFAENEAEKKQKQSEVLQYCNTKKLPSYLMLEDGLITVDEEVFEELEVSDKSYSDMKFRLELEQIRLNYHQYIQCFFDASTAYILDRSGGTVMAAISVNAPNFANLMDPEYGCIDQNQLGQIINGMGPDALVEPALLAYNAYSRYLNIFYNAHERNYKMEAGFIDFESANQALKTQRRLIDNEVNDAKVALNTAFNMLTEMRQMFVIHVHFQCMLKNLEEYRRLLEKIRNFVEALPPTIEDASMHRGG